MVDDLPYYLGATLSSGLYALALEALGSERYEPDLTVLTVMGGVGLTGGWVALRLALAPLPAGLPDLALAWWVWWVTFWMFVATGAPIVAWQVWQSRVRLAALLAYLRSHGHGHEANPAAALATERGGAADADD